jgi:predicted nucleotidyltransferase
MGYFVDKKRVITLMDSQESELPDKVPGEALMMESLPVLAPALNVINQLESEGIIGKPTIGGSIAVMYYATPMLTDDLDVFCYLPGQSFISSTAPVLQRLKELGYETTVLGAEIEGIEVQFLGPGSGVVTEALEHSVSITIEGVPFHVFEYEYALAVKADAGRRKDWLHISAALEATQPDENKLHAILNKYDLLKKWKRKLEDE